MLSDFIKDLITAYNGYFGNGFFVFLLIIGTIYALVNNKISKIGKRICIYLPALIVILAIINPIYWKLANKTADYSYARTYWNIPFYLILAYISSCVILSVKQTKNKIILFILISLLIVTGGIGMLSEGPYSYKFIQNEYKLPQQVIEVADIIADNNGEESLIMAPREINMYIREYLYNIKVFISSWNREIYVNDQQLDKEKGKINIQINSEAPDINYLLEVAKRSECDFIVLSVDAEIDVMSEYGYFKIGETTSYNVYQKK